VAAAVYGYSCVELGKYLFTQDYDSQFKKKNKMLVISLLVIAGLAWFTFNVSMLDGFIIFFCLPFLSSLLICIFLTIEMIEDKKKKQTINKFLKDNDVCIYDFNQPLFRWVKTQGWDSSATRSKLYDLWNYYSKVYYAVYIPGGTQNGFKSLLRVAPQISTDLLEDIRLIKDDLEKVKSAYRLQALLYYLQGWSWEKIEKKILEIEAADKEKQRRKDARQEKIEARREAIRNWKIWTIFRWSALPFIWLWRGIVWLWQKIVQGYRWVGRILSDLQKIHAIMESFCPHQEERPFL